VFTLGWKPELFDNFDSSVQRGYGRDAHKAERVGKKYQWIGLHELLARATDNFEFRDESWSSTRGVYAGPWQLSVRDIDPSSVLRETGGKNDTLVGCWWMRVRYDAWAARTGDVQWIKRHTDLPRVPRLINIRDRAGTEYMVLEGHFHWEQPTPPEQERYEHERRDLWFMVKSYLVKRSDADKLYSWAASQDFMGRWMPESHEFYNVFLREFPWAPAFQSIDSPYHSRTGWTDQGHSGETALPVEVLVTDDGYLKEVNGFDCSVEDSIHIRLPARWIYDGMNLKPTPDDGAFSDGKDRVVVFDPSVKENGPGALLVRKDALRRCLRETECDIVWTVLGEKRLIGGRVGSGYWPGRLEVSGAYRLDSRAQVVGVSNVKVRQPE
jgi:hypothetical protein